MNYLYKRSIISRRPFIFQDGGQSVFIPQAQPYRIDIPIAGPSANPAVANKPVDINTSGLTDAINKQKDLAYKYAELDFRYKDLEYKEGKEYLELLKEQFKGLGNTKEYLEGLGGISNFGEYKDLTSAFTSQYSKLQSDAALAAGKKDRNGFANAVAGLSSLVTDPNFMELKLRTQTLSKLLDAATKGEMGYLTPRFMNAFNSHLLGDEASRPPWEQVVKLGTDAAGLKIKTSDVTSLLTDFYDRYEKNELVKTDVGTRVLPSGQVEVVSEYKVPTIDQLAAEFKSWVLKDEVGKSYLYNQGINPDNPNSEELNNFIYGAISPFYQNLVSKYGPFKEFSKQTEKDVQITEEGKILSINPATGKPRDFEGDGEGGTGGVGKGKMSDSDKRVAAYQEEFADIYGNGVVDDPVLNSIFRTGKNREEIVAEAKKHLESQGMKPLSETLPGKGGTSSVVPGTDFPNTLEGIKTKFPQLEIDPETTKLFEKDGILYLVTADDNVKDVVADYELALKKEDFYLDQMVRDKVGANDIKGDPKEWDINAITEFRTSTSVYNLGPASEVKKAGEGGGLSEEAGVMEGDENFVYLNPEDPVGSQMPRASDFKNPINQGLARRSLPVLNEYGLRVTDTSDSKLHRSSAQVKYKTGFDVNYEVEKGRGPNVLPLEETRPKIAKTIEAFRNQGLTAVYEVKTKANKDALLKESKEKGWGLTSDMIQVVSYITGNHFSVACPNCTKYTEVNSGGDTILPTPEDARKELMKNKLISSRYESGKLTDSDISYLTNFLASEEIQDGFFRDVVYPRQVARKNDIVMDMPEIRNEFTDNEILYIVSHQGSAGARYFFKNNPKKLSSDSKEDYKIHPDILAANKNSSLELKRALPKVSKGDYVENVIKNESSGNPMAVYKGSAKSSAIGKYQILGITFLKDIKKYIDQYGIDAEGEEEANVDMSESTENATPPAKSAPGAFMNALQKKLGI